MNRKALIAIALVSVTAVTGALAATSDEGVNPRVLNGIKHATKKDGSLKPSAVGHRQLKNGIVSCQKLTSDLRLKLCRGLFAIPGPKGPTGPAGSAGTNGTEGAIGQNGVQGATGEQGNRGDGVILVNNTTPGICYTNPTVNLTTLGVVFGPYSSNEQGGSVCVDIGKGHTLADLARLEYSAAFTATKDNGDAPYLRIFIDNDQDGVDEHDVIYSPSTQPGACYGPLPIPGVGSQCATRGRLIHYVVTQGTVRYDDDAGNLPDLPWAEVVNAHATDKIDAIYVTSGFSLPDTTGAVLNSLTYEIAGSLPTTLAFAHP